MDEADWEYGREKEGREIWGRGIKEEQEKRSGHGRGWEDCFGELLLFLPFPLPILSVLFPPPSSSFFSLPPPSSPFSPPSPTPPFSSSLPPLPFLLYIQRKPRKNLKKSLDNLKLDDKIKHESDTFKEKLIRI